MVFDKVVLVTIAFGFLGCGSGGVGATAERCLGKDSADLVGAWKRREFSAMQPADAYERYRFCGDASSGTFTTEGKGVTSKSCRFEQAYEGTFRTDGKVLTLTFTSGSTTSTQCPNAEENGTRSVKNPYDNQYTFDVASSGLTLNNIEWSEGPITYVRE